MNVPLRRTLASSSSYNTEAPNNLNKNPGFFVLFNSPHPARCSNEENAFVDRNFIDDGDSNTTDKTSSLVQSSGSVFSSDKKRDNAIVFASLKSLVELDGGSKISGSNDSSNSYYNPRASMSVKERSLSVSASIVPFGRHTFQFTEGAASSSYALASDANSNAMQKRFFYQPVSIGKKSLHKPIADLSLRNLRFVANIDMENDSRCKSFVGGMFDQTYALKFAAMYGTYLDSVYVPTSLSTTTTTTAAAAAAASHKIQEEVQEFRDDKVRKSSSGTVLPEGHSMSNVTGFQKAESLSSKQAVNLFELGCIIAELYLGKPLLSKADFIAANDFASLQKVAFSRTADMPLILRRLVAELVGNDEGARPTAKEILQACTLADYEKWHNYDVSELKSCGSQVGYVDFNSIEEFMPKLLDRSIEKSKQKAAKREEIAPHYVFGERVERLSNSCAGLFPSYFNVAYRIIGELKTSRDGFEKVITFMRNINSINSIPLDGLNLMLKHLLVIIEDPEPFRNANGDADDTSSSFSPNNFPLKCHDALVLEYPILVDCLGSRLGIDGTEKLIIPKVLAFLNNFQSVRMLRYVLQSSLWNVLIIRAGVKNFLRHIFPLLLTYLSAGILHNVSKLAEQGPFLDSGNQLLPQLLWTMSSSNQQGNYANSQSSSSNGKMLKNDWLQLCAFSSIKKVQGDAVVAISGLMDIESLGYGLCARYIVPPLLSLVGIPHLAMALFTLKEDVFFTYERSLREADKIVINYTSDDVTNDEVFSQQSGEHIISFAEVSKIFARLVIRLDVCRENLFRSVSLL